MKRGVTGNELCSRFVICDVFFFSMMLFVCLFVCFSFHSRSDPSIDIKIHSTNSNNTLFHKATRSSAVLLLAGNGATNENALNDNGESPLSMSLNGWRTDSLIALLTLNVDTTRVEASGVCVCVWHNWTKVAFVDLTL